MAKNLKLLVGLMLASIVALSIASACSDGDDNQSEDGDATATAELTSDPAEDDTPEATTEPNGDATPGDETPTVGEREGNALSTPANDQEAALVAAAEAVIAVLDAGDRSGLRNSLEPDEREDITEEDLDDMFECWAEGTLREPPMGEIDLKEERGRIDVIYLRTSGPTISEVNRPWEFRLQDDGSWQLRRLPPCPPSNA